MRDVHERVTNRAGAPEGYKRRRITELPSDGRPGRTMEPRSFLSSSHRASRRSSSLDFFVRANVSSGPDYTSLSLEDLHAASEAALRRLVSKLQSISLEPPMQEYGYRCCGHATETALSRQLLSLPQPLSEDSYELAGVDQLPPSPEGLVRYRIRLRCCPEVASVLAAAVIFSGGGSLHLSLPGRPAAVHATLSSSDGQDTSCLLVIDIPEGTRSRYAQNPVNSAVLYKALSQQLRIAFVAFADAWYGGSLALSHVHPPVASATALEGASLDFLQGRFVAFATSGAGLPSTLPDLVIPGLAEKPRLSRMLLCAPPPSRLGKLSFVYNVETEAVVLYNNNYGGYEFSDALESKVKRRLAPGEDLREVCARRTDNGLVLDAICSVGSLMKCSALWAVVVPRAAKDAVVIKEYDGLESVSIDANKFLVSQMDERMDEGERLHAASCWRSLKEQAARLTIKQALEVSIRGRDGVCITTAVVFCHQEVLDRGHAQIEQTVLAWAKRVNLLGHRASMMRGSLELRKRNGNGQGSYADFTIAVARQ